MIYKAKQITIRPLTVDDLTDDYLNWMHDPEVCRYTSHGRFAQSKQEIEAFARSLDSRDNIIWAIIAKDQNIHIGNVALQQIDLINRSAEIAIVIGNKDYWGKGIATEAFSLVINHAFNTLGLTRVWTGTVCTNIAMKEVAIKLHMQREGRRRSAVFLEGEYIDVIEYGLLREEWNQKEPF
jgi:RimJ/RimL family protein N-acetyltransferase